MLKAFLLISRKSILLGSLFGLSYFAVDVAIEYIYCHEGIFASLIDLLTPCTPHEKIMRIMGMIAFFMFGLFVNVVYERIRNETEMSSRLSSQLEKQVKAEEALRESDKKHRGFLENLNAGVVVHAPDTTVLYCNSMALQILGLTMDQMIGKTAMDPQWTFVSEDGTALTLEDYPVALTLRTGSDLNNYVIGILHPERSDVTWVVCNSYQARDTDNKLDHVVISFFDISKRKRAEVALAKNKRSIAITLDSIGDAVISTDIAGNVVRMNRVAEELTGWSADEAVGQRLSEVFRIVNGLTRKTVESPVTKVLQEGIIVGLANHTVLVSRDGTEYQIADSGAPIKEVDGAIEGVVLVFRDVTKQYETQRIIRESEERYNELFRNISSGVAVYEAVEGGGDFIFKDFNKAGEKIDNLKKEQVLGKKVTEVFPGVKDFGIFDVFQRVWETGQPEHYPVSMYEDQRVVGWRENYIYKLPSGEVVAVYDDVTERMKAGEEIKKALEEKEILLREIHHRVKNNMAIIYSLHQLQANSAKNKDIKQMFMESNNRIRSMALIHEKLYQSDSLASIDVKDYLNSLTRNLLHSFSERQKKISLELDVDDITLGIDVLIPCGLIITELVTNSLKYAFKDKESGTIAIGLRTENSALSLTIKDNGCGLPEGMDFHTTDSLGLKIVSALINQLEGELQIVRDSGTAYKILFVEHPHEV